jgi:hypothetical protein
MNTESINCFKCKHFYITWDKNFPNGCKAFGFKAKSLPSVAVYEASGQNCQAFETKPERSI